jgi:hypothetical protein
MKLIKSTEYKTKKEICKEKEISERYFFYKLEQNKSKYPQEQMNKKRGFWMVRNDIIDEVFTKIRKPKSNDDNIKWVNYVKQQTWDIIGSIRGWNFTIKQNKEIIKDLFNELKNQYPTRPITIYSTIEENDQTNQYYHIHYLVKMNICNEELKKLNNELFNIYPSFWINRYDYDKHLLKGVEYILFNKGTQIPKPNYITLSTRKKHE